MARVEIKFARNIDRAPRTGRGASLRSIPPVGMRAASASPATCRAGTSARASGSRRSLASLPRGVPGRTASPTRATLEGAADARLRRAGAASSARVQGRRRPRGAVETLAVGSSAADAASSDDARASAGGNAAVSLVTSALPKTSRGSASNDDDAFDSEDASSSGAAPRPSSSDVGSSTPSPSPAKRAAPSLVAFTGGTAFNGVVDELTSELTSRVMHVIPVSDDGGSTAEIVRVLGGPAVGDVRSRCLRLSDESTAEARAVKALLAHRLHATDSAEAKAEWYRIQEGDHELWANISEPYADIIRSFLLHFHSQVTAAKTDGPKFDFVNGSVGNFFFAGARMFFRSMEAAILLYSRVSNIPEESTVVPNIVLGDNVRVALGAELENGVTIRGQNEISHPSPDPKTFTKTGPLGRSGAAGGKTTLASEILAKSKTVSKARASIKYGRDVAARGKAQAASSEFWKGVIERGGVPEISASEFWGGLEESAAGHARVRDAIAAGDVWSAGELINSRLIDLTTRPLSVWDIDKVISGYDELQSPIKRVFYLSTEDPTSLAVVYPKVNPTITRRVEKGCDGVIYGMGSLYTSIVPSLILEGVGEAIAEREDMEKVLILNGAQDRETGDMDAVEYVTAVVNALNRAEDPDPTRRAAFGVRDYVTVAIAPEGGGIPLDVDELKRIGVREVVTVKAKRTERGAEYDVPALIEALGGVFRRE